MSKSQLALSVVMTAFALSVWAGDKPADKEAAGPTIAADQRQTDDAKKKHPPTGAVGGAVEKQKSPEGAKTHPPTGAMDKAMPTQKAPETK